MAALNICLDDTLRHQEDPFYSTENQACLLAAKERMEQTGVPFMG